jgi:hypothetical protein
MPLVLEEIAPAARARYIAIGRNFSSHDTLAQGDDTSRALAAHGSVLLLSGIGPRDIERLNDARAQLVAAGVTRTAAKAGVKTTSQAYLNALAAGKQARREAQAILLGARTDLADSGAADDAQSIDNAINAGSSAGSDGATLRTQLQRLRDALATPAIATAAADRGGAASVTAIDAAITALRAAEAARPGGPGTPAETETLDLLDGIIVDICRRARRAARAAAKAQGSPALAEEFELRALYRSTKKTPEPVTPPA